MNGKTVLSLVGLVTIAVVSVVYMNVLGLGFAVPEDKRAASVEVPDTNGLVVGSKVLVRGIEVGRIDRIQPGVGSVRMDWSYSADIDIPVDSRFRVESLSALGETYLAVLPRTESGPYLEDGATVAQGDVDVPTSVQELVARLNRLLDQVSPEQIQDIRAEIDEALPDDGVVLVDLNRAWSLFAHITESRADDLTYVFSNLQTLLADSAWLPPGLSGTSVDFRKLGVDMGAWLTDSTYTSDYASFPYGIADGAGPFIGELQKFLDRSAPDLRVLGVALTPGARAAASAIRTMNIAQVLDNAIEHSRDGRITIDVAVPKGN